MSDLKSAIAELHLDPAVESALLAIHDDLEAAWSARLAEVERERDALRREQAIACRHPMAPERCPSCEWTNTNLMNYGEPGKSLWLCHTCAAVAIQDRDQARQERDAAVARCERITAELTEYIKRTGDRCAVTHCALEPGHVGNHQHKSGVRIGADAALIGLESALDTLTPEAPTNSVATDSTLVGGAADLTSEDVEALGWVCRYLRAEHDLNWDEVDSGIARALAALDKLTKGPR